MSGFQARPYKFNPRGGWGGQDKSKTNYSILNYKSILKTKYF